MTVILLVVISIVLALSLFAVLDIVQRQHAIRRNFPIVGRLRYWLEAVGPELRQYIVTNNDEERPFSRDERRWVYTTAKGENSYFGFGTDNELEALPNYLVIKHAAFPLPGLHPSSPGFDPAARLPSAKVLGGHRGRRHAFRPESVVNVSALSLGALSGNAIRALNLGAAQAGCLHNTGEGGIARQHLAGGELIWQIGTGHFGARDDHGGLDLQHAVELVERHPVRAIEIKLSQGAKPGIGGLLPAAKVSREIAEVRGVPRGVDCASPSTHSEFHDVDSMLDFVERVAEATGLPVGIKSAVGEQPFWDELADLMARGDRGVDFITIDGSEGGTGAGPLAFTDHVALPFKIGFSRVYRAFERRGVAQDVTFIGSAKLGLPENCLLAFALGADMVNVGREAMLAIGCIQAQRCHTNHCPTGVATQSRWLARGLEPTSKGERAGNYIIGLRRELLALARACGVPHPSLVTAEQIEIIDGRFGSETAAQVFGYEPGWGLPSPDQRAEIERLLGFATPVD